MLTLLLATTLAAIPHLQPAVTQTGPIPSGTPQRVGDLNGDGLDELAVAGNNAQIALSQPGGRGAISSFDVEIDLGAWVESMSSGDLNGDGDNDLVVFAGGEVHVYFGPITGPVGTADFLVDGTPPHQWGMGSAAVLPDQDGDGDDELVMGSFDGLYVVPGDPSLSGVWDPAAAGLVQDYPSGSQIVVLDDLDGDGLVEIATGDSQSRTTGVLFSPFRAVTTPIMAADAALYLSAGGPRSILGTTSGGEDIDGDGLDDLVVDVRRTHGVNTLVIISGADLVGLALGRGHDVTQLGREVLPRRPHGSIGTSHAVVADLTGNGRAEIVFTHQDHILVMEGTVASSLPVGVATTVPAGVWVIVPEPGFRLGEWAQVVATGDQSGNGQPGLTLMVAGPAGGDFAVAY